MGILSEWVTRVAPRSDWRTFSASSKPAHEQSLLDDETLIGRLISQRLLSAHVRKEKDKDRIHNHEANPPHKSEPFDKAGQRP